MELSTGKILEVNLFQSAFQQTLGDKFTYQQDNDLKHKAKYTLELLTKMTLNVPEVPSYKFDLKRLENGCLAIINNQLDRARRIKKIIICKLLTLPKVILTYQAGV